MSHVTYDGPDYTSVHHETCGHLGKHQGGDYSHDEKYVEHQSVDEAERYAEQRGGEVKHCSSCN